MKDKDTYLIEEQYKNLFEQKEEQPFTQEQLRILLVEQFNEFHYMIHGIFDYMGSQTKDLVETDNDDIVENIIGETEEIDQHVTEFQKLLHYYNSGKVSQFLRLIIEMNQWQTEIDALLSSIDIDFESLEDEHIQPYVSYLNSIINN